MSRTPAFAVLAVAVPLLGGCATTLNDVRGGPVQSRRFHFKGGRVEVRMQSVAVALQGLLDLLR